MLLNGFTVSQYSLVALEFILPDYVLHEINYASYIHIIYIFVVQFSKIWINIM